MSRQEKQYFAKCVCQYFENVAGMSKKITAQHFMNEARAKSTIYGILARYEVSGESIYKPISGRPAEKSSPKNVKKVEKAFKKCPTLSVRSAALKLKLDKSTVSRIKVHKLGITAETKKKSPKYLPGQAQRAKTYCRKVFEKTRKKVLIIDDETYVTIDPSQLPCRSFVHAKDHSQLKFEDKFKQITKFPKKYLIWQAIDEIGNVSEPYISEGTMKSPMYLKECLKKRLVPFILQHHKKDDVLFWPDLARIHYADIVTDFLQEEKIDFVTKKDNPPNVPQARGIEKFWAECKRQYIARKEGAKNLRGMKLIWPRISKAAAEKCGKAVMDHAYKYLSAIGRKGVQGAMCDLSHKKRSKQLKLM